MNTCIVVIGVETGTMYTCMVEQHVWVWGSNATLLLIAWLIKCVMEYVFYNWLHSICLFEWIF